MLVSQFKSLRGPVRRAMLMCAMITCSIMAFSYASAQSFSAGGGGTLVCDEIQSVCEDSTADDGVEYVATEDGAVAPSVVVAACKANTTSASTRQACYGASNALPSKRAAEAIAACGDATGTDTAFGTCLKRAKKLATYQVQAIRSCDEITTNDADMNSCMLTLVDFGHFSAGRTLEACIANTTLRSSVDDCMSAAKRLTREHVPVVQACGSGYGTDKSRITCIKRTAAR